MMKRIEVDFNTLNSAPEDLVKLPRDGSVPPLAEGECVVLYDADGLEVEATIVSYVTPWGEHRFMAEPDANTWHDTIPQDVSSTTAHSAD